MNAISPVPCVLPILLPLVRAGVRCPKLSACWTHWLLVKGSPTSSRLVVGSPRYIRRLSTFSGLLSVGRLGMQYRWVRGVTLPTVQGAGRNLRFDKNRDRILLSEIRQAVIEQSGIFSETEIMPLPCNPEAIAIGYGLREGQQVTPITRWIPWEDLQQSMPNAISFE